MEDYFKITNLNINDRFEETNEKIEEIKRRIEYPDFYGLVDIVSVNIIINENEIYGEGFTALDEIFESYSGKYYMKVFINGHFIEIDVDKIEYVTRIAVLSTGIIKQSYIVDNWYDIKNQILRTKKLSRILDDE